VEGRTHRTRWIHLVVAIVLFAAPAQAGTGGDVTKGAVLIGTNLLYVPAKLIYAATGSLVAAAAYAVSAGDSEVVDPILAAAVRGDYLIQEAHLKGEKPLEFIGRLEAHERVRDVAAGPPPDQGEDAGF